MFFQYRYISTYLIVCCFLLSCVDDTNQNTVHDIDLDSLYTQHKMSSEKDDVYFCDNLAECYINKDSVKQIVVNIFCAETIDTIIQFVNIESLTLRNGHVGNDIVFFRKLGILKRLRSIRLENVKLDSVILDSKFMALKEFEDLDNIFNHKYVFFSKNLSIEKLIIHVENNIPESLKNLNQLKSLMIDVTNNDTVHLDRLLTPTIDEIFIPSHISNIKLERRTSAVVNITLDGTMFLDNEIKWYQEHKKFNILCSLQKKGPNLSFISLSKPLQIDCN